MTTKKKAARAGTCTASNTASYSLNHTTGRALIVWFNRAKSSRNSQQKHGVALKAKVKELIVRLAMWGLIPAGFATWLIQRGGMRDA